jgi:hypothetical protein
MREPLLDGALRRLDFAKQVVTTSPVKTGWKGKILADSKGRLILLAGDGSLQYFDENGKAVEQKKLQMNPDVLIGSLLLDEAHERLYGGCEYNSKSWYVWYWDLKDGSFHGVLPAWQPGEPKHGLGGMVGPDPGPFKGTSFYPQMACFWGADDPEKNFLYILPNDCMNFYRLDLKKEEVWCSSLVGNEVAIVGTGSARKIGVDFCGWLPDGSFISSDRPWDGARIWRCRRVK